MSALALISQEIGFKVTGSDRVFSNNITNLLSKGISIKCPSNIQDLQSANIVVYSAAVSKEDKELLFAKNANIPICSRGEFLGFIEKRFSKSIAIAGCHGKSTVSSIIAYVMTKALLNPSYHIGAKSINLKNTFKLASKEYFITEACEYKRSFLWLSPYISAIISTDLDHTDCYKSKQEILDAYVLFARYTQKFCIVPKDFPQMQNTITCGLDNSCYYTAKNIIQTENYSSFDFIKNNEKLFSVETQLLGLHNIENVLFALSILTILKIDNQIVIDSIKTYKGIERRLEYLETIENTKIYSDYAHHPTEVYASINALKTVGNNILVVYEPHTYSRTKKFLKEFSTSFEKAKNVFVVPTYAAREEYDELGSAKRLANIIGEKASYIDKNIIEKINLSDYDIVVFMGAGNIDKMAKKFIEIKNNIK